MDERRKIARWRMAGIGVEVIAEKLGRHRSTIYRELKRNTFQDHEFPENSGHYIGIANDMSKERRQASPQHRHATTGWLPGSG